MYTMYLTQPIGITFAVLVCMHKRLIAVGLFTKNMYIAKTGNLKKLLLKI